MSTVFITGASGSIGSALCQVFSENGYRVLGIDLLEPAHSYCELFERVDLSTLGMRGLPPDLNAATQHGLDVLINNAAHQVVKPFESISWADWQRSLSVNLSVPFYLSHRMLEPLKKKQGSIINITSIHAELTKPGFSAYATTKGGLSTLTKALAVELGQYGIRVNAIQPAAVRTPMLEAGFTDNPEGYQALKDHHPSGCIGEPIDIAKAALFLANSQTNFTSGSILKMDGAISHRLHDPA